MRNFFYFNRANNIYYLPPTSVPFPPPFLFFFFFPLSFFLSFFLSLGFLGEFSFIIFSHLFPVCMFPLFLSFSLYLLSPSRIKKKQNKRREFLNHVYLEFFFAFSLFFTAEEDAEEEEEEKVLNDIINGSGRIGFLGVELEGWKLELEG